MLSGLLTLIIALLTVAFQSLRAAQANPAESLRYE
jgi:ABC-type antimicrobial peptide transport system permease subunit